MSQDPPRPHEIRNETPVRMTRLVVDGHPTVECADLFAVLQRIRCCLPPLALSDRARLEDMLLEWAVATRCQKSADR